VTLTFADKLFPNQPEQLKRYTGPPEDVARRIAAFCDEQIQLPQFKINCPPAIELADMASPPTVLALLQFLIRTTHRKRILEIGSFVGLSAMTMASALEYGGAVITLEKNPIFAAFARSNIAANFPGLNPIKLVECDALEYLRVDHFDRYDFVFIDGAKEHYDEYLRMLTLYLSRGAIVVIDDCFFNGDVLNFPPETMKGTGVAAALNFLKKAHGTWDRVMLPMCNGLAILRHR
jgi:predicted O-methyltransferase YrrM